MGCLCRVCLPTTTRKGLAGDLGGAKHAAGIRLIADRTGNRSFRIDDAENLFSREANQTGYSPLES